MSDKEKNKSLIDDDARGVSKAIITLIDKLCSVSPYLTDKQGEATERKQKWAIKNEIAKRAGDRILQQQRNIESIAHKSEEYMLSDGREEKARNLNPDFAATFADKCKNASEEEIQKLWAKVLAGEADTPASFSKKTLSILGDINKKDAELFTTLCQFVWTDTASRIVPLIYNLHDTIYTAQGADFESLKYLSELGLVTYSSAATEYFRTYVAQEENTSQSRRAIWSYYGKKVAVSLKPENDKYQMNIGKCAMTRAGEELFRICGAQKNDEFFHYMIKKWEKEGLNPVVSEQTQSPNIATE